MYITGYQYIKSETGFKTGVKNGKVPKNAVGGGNGTFITAISPKVIVFLSNKDSFDAYNIIKSAASKRVTEKLVSKIFAPLVGQEMDSRREIEKSIKKYSACY